MIKNSLSKRGYILEILFWVAIAFIWYKNLFFINVEGKTVFESTVILIGIIAVCICVNAALTMCWRRNIVSEITTVIIPYGVYTYITYVKYMDQIYKIIIGIGMCLSLSLVCFILVAKLNVKAIKKRLLFKTKMSYLAVRFVGAVTSVAIITFPFCQTYIEGALITPKEKATDSYGEEYTIAENIDTVLLLQEAEWKALSLEERMDVLQCICNIEGNYLGINKAIHIYASILDDDVMGCYQESTSTIYLSIDLLKSGNPYETLDTVCHEMFHAAQHRYVEIYEKLDNDAKDCFFFVNAAVYAGEFKNYKSGKKTGNKQELYDYYTQLCEQDARSYASDAVTDYYERIDEYLNEQD